MKRRQFLLSGAGTLCTTLTAAGGQSSRDRLHAQCLGASFLPGTQTTQHAHPGTALVRFCFDQANEADLTGVSDVSATAGTPVCSRNCDNPDVAFERFLLR